MANDIDLILASSSPRRAELLHQIGVRFIIQPPNVNESQLEGEDPETYVQRLALAKAEAVARHASIPDLPVLGADTTVVLDNTIFSKPVDKTAAIASLRALSGRCHEVLSAIAVVAEGRAEVRLCKTSVSFRTIKEEEYEYYWSTGEPKDKAGAYAIQGLGGIFVARIDGSYSGVVGLPLAQTFELFERFNIACWNT